MKYDLSTSNIITGIGFLITLLGLFIGFIPSIVGIVLILVGLYMLSESLSIKAFQYALISFALGFLATIIFSVLILKSILGLIFGGLSSSVWLIGMSGMGIILAFLISYILSLVSAYFFFKSMKDVSEKIDHPLIFLTGIMVLVGTALLILFGLGAIIIGIGFLMGAIAFFTAPNKLKTSESLPSDPPQERKLPLGQ